MDVARAKRVMRVWDEAEGLGPSAGCGKRSVCYESLPGVCGTDRIVG